MLSGEKPLQRWSFLFIVNLCNLIRTKLSQRPNSCCAGGLSRVHREEQGNATPVITNTASCSLWLSFRVGTWKSSWSKINKPSITPLSINPVSTFHTMSSTKAKPSSLRISRLLSLFLISLRYDFCTCIFSAVHIAHSDPRSQSRQEAQGLWYVPPHIALRSSG